MSSTPPAMNELAQLRQELNELRSVVSGLRGNGHGNGGSFMETAEANGATDRRGMLKKMGAMAVGVAAVGLLKPSTSGAAVRYVQGGTKEGGVPDATGGNFIIGQSNFPSAPADVTSIINPGSTLCPRLFRADNYASSPFVVPANSVCTLVGHVNDVNATPTGQNLYGIYGQAEATTGFAYGVYGLAGTVAAPDGDGVTGVGNRGVVGVGVGNGCGVDGTVNGGTNGWAITGISDIGVGGQFNGGRCALYLNAGGGAVADPNVTAPAGSSTGDVYRGSTNGSLWYNAGGTRPYRRVADATTAGALTAFAASGRFVNTIAGSGAPYAGQTLAAGATASYQIGGVTAGGATVPATARAIIGRIADPNPSGAGNLLVGATNPPVGGVLAIVAGAPQNSFFFSALSATGVLFVKNNGSGPTDIIIDIQGYYL